MPATPAQLSLADDVVMKRHADALRDLLGDRADVRFGRHDRMLYATDASIYQVEPLGVVIPRDLAAATQAVRYCVEHRLPILPRGGGTSLAGQGVNRAVVIDFSPYCRSLLVAPASDRGGRLPGNEGNTQHRSETGATLADVAATCTVEPGITIDDLNDALRPSGLFFAPDPATARQCNIGGAIGNNAAGTRSILYGRTSENVEAISVLLATPECRSPVTLAEGSCLTDPVVRRLGEGVIDIVTRHERLIRERFPKTLRRNAGYALDMMLDDIEQARATRADPLSKLNLAHLICGSEGTLAVTVGATLRLHPIPRAKGLAVIGFDTLDGAIDAVMPVLPLRPSAVELLDDMVIGLARANTEYARYVELMPRPASGRNLAAVLYVEFFSNTGPDEINAKLDELRALLGRAAPGAGFAAYTDADQMARALKLRKAGEPLLHAIPGRRKPLGFVEDNAVPVEHLAEFVREFRRIVENAGTRAAFWAHASVGVLHVRPLLDLRDHDDRERMERMAVDVAGLAKRLGGVMSGEHGDGRVRGPLLERFFGPELMSAFREVKTLFDPLNLLNPGNIVSPGDVPSIHERTRPRPLGHDLHAPQIDTYFDYSAEDGFDHAVELCNGAGVCRKKQGGTMCPSYMATLDERHSTRGRGNALRLAITGQLSPAVPHAPPQWNDPDTLETLHLCLSCKACKTECPSNVDIARYKAEYLAQSYRDAGRVPLKARVFGNVRALNRLGSAFAPVSNWVARSVPSRLLADRILGLSPRRSLPAFARSLFRLRPVPPRGERPAVVLFADCFTAYNEPGIGLATIRVLEVCGYRVVLPDAGCCARAAISTGLLDQARRTIAATTSSLLRAVEEHRAVAVVVCEPSCLSAIKDDWLALGRSALRADSSKKPSVDLDPAPARHSGAIDPAPGDVRPGEKSARRADLPEDTFARLASISFLPEDFIEQYWDRHPHRPAFKQPSAPPAERGHQQEVLLHAHCHQKALWGADTSARLLRRVLGDRLRVLDSGCCGMAGSFGYTADRYDLSMKIGELSLFPAIRDFPGAVAVATGTSCRHQIHDAVGVHAMHPIELIASMLTESPGSP